MIVPQVSSTVAGLLQMRVDSGSPTSVHSFLSNSSLSNTLPTHSVSNAVSYTHLTLPTILTV